MNSRIRQVIEHLGISQKVFAKALDISPGRVSNVTTGRNKPDSEFLARLIKVYPMVNPAWLLTGEGEMIISEKQKSESKSSNHYSGTAIDHSSSDRAEEGDVDQLYGNSGLLPVVGLNETGLFLKNLYNSAWLRKLPTVQLSFPFSEEPGVVFQVGGHNMEKRINHGDYVVCARVRKPDQLLKGNIFVLILDSEVLCLRLAMNYEEGQPLQFESDNPQFFHLSKPWEDIRQLWKVVMVLSTNINLIPAFDPGLEIEKKLDSIASELKDKGK